MNINKETLEKMAYLHSCGFEPSSYFDIEGVHGRHFVDKDYAEAELSGLINDLKELKPYFTESRLWSLLPDNLYEDLYEFGINKSGIGYLPGEGRSGRLMRWKAFNNLHTGLLDLTIWACKQGHLKAEEKQ